MRSPFALAEYIKLGNWYLHLPVIIPYVAILGTLLITLCTLPLLIWLERVLLALIQDRSGPNRVGPRGLFQPVADVLKLFFKEDIHPKSVDVTLYFLAPMIVVTTAFSAGGVLPLQAVTFIKHATYSLNNGHLFGGTGEIITRPLIGGDVNIGFLYILALASLQVYGVVLAGWSSNNKYSLLGGLRASAQVISYELSMGMSLLSVVLMTGSLKLSDIVQSQDILPFVGAPEIFRGSVFTWFWLRTLLVPVIIYTISMIAECNRAPFDLAEAESELTAGFFTEYSSLKFAMFFTAEYVSMLTVSALNAAMFWGGPLPPLNIAPLTWIPGFVWLFAKTMLGIFFFIWVRGSVPRLRYDSLMNLGWKRMLPVGLLWIFLLAGVSLVMQTVAPGLFPEKPVAQIVIGRSN